jgi:hypothetical protein
MAKIIRLGGALAPAVQHPDCGNCAHFYKRQAFPPECRECRWFPYAKGNLKNNFVFTAVRLGRPDPERA